MLNKFTYYQPIAYFDDGTNIEYGDIPVKLWDFEVFPTSDECKKWLENNGYDPDDFVIIEYNDDDIEEPIFINEYGDEIDED